MILSFRPLGQTERRMVDAVIRTNHPLSSYGQPAIVLEDGDVLDIFSWRVRGYKVVRADRKEMKALVRMGVL